MFLRTGAMARAHMVAIELSALTREAGLSRCAAFVQHGDTSCLLHCVAVAFYSALLLDALRIRYDRRSLIRGALLHDFFLYDWHQRKRAPHEPMHAFYHPIAALENARKCVALTPLEENIIRRHMFPVTLVPPASREGLAVCLVDKLCALYEGFARGSYPLLRRLYARLLADSPEISDGQ
ncbi:MAG TPA: phosphohydrolase [Candidatus Faecivicinus avistercoris]|nr:phosphohydrolase [Candidatus Faecivicinus avistercoris]